MSPNADGQIERVIAAGESNHQTRLFFARVTARRVQHRTVGVLSVLQQNLNNSNVEENIGVSISVVR